jgi:hypothetical protein
MRLSRRLPVISSTLRAPAGFAGVNLFIAETLFWAGFYHASWPLTNATRLCQPRSNAGWVEIQVRPSRKWRVPRTGAERTSGYASTESAGSRRLQTGIT